HAIDKTLWFTVPVLLLGVVHTADLKVDLSRETVGRSPTTFEPMVGTRVVVEDGGEKAIMVDGRPWVASKDSPTKLLLRVHAHCTRHPTRSSWTMRSSSRPTRWRS